MVSFELDAGWCAAAGFDPIAFVEQYSGRVKLIHVKESDRVIGPQKPVDFGELPKDEKGVPIFPEELKRQMEEMDKTNCAAGKGLVDWKTLKETADRKVVRHISWNVSMLRKENAWNICRQTSTITVRKSNNRR